MKKTAIIFGSTGLVGNELLHQIVEVDNYSKIILFNRQAVGFVHSKIDERIVDFNNLSEISADFSSKDVFCCLGTTMKKAGSQEKFRDIDLELPVNLATIAKDKNTKNFIVVSSIGADAKSRNFYLRTKGGRGRITFAGVF